ncbi:hypothetical protein [Paenibacillus daejeonensis]|uniref:hypothetical protein n=1 Tax=Paenibacillus daejeonensis TaxID=135193 RepID=UPI00037E0EAD|nr:hypothetical protein [Paenibacillus daejeonensis]
MKLSEITACIPPHVMDQLIEDPVWNGARRQGMTWLQAQTQAEVLATARAELPLEAQDVLKLIVSRFGVGRFGLEQLMREASSGLWSGTELRYGLEFLHSCGIVWCMKIGWGEQAYLLPEDTFRLWLREFYPADLEPLPASDPVKRLPAERIEGGLCCELLHTMAALVRLGFSWTRSRTLPKRVLQRLESQLQLPEAAARGLPLLGGLSTDSYPPRVAWLLDLSLMQGWLSEGEEGYIFHEQCWQAWLDQAPHACEAALADLVLSDYLAAEDGRSYPAAVLAEQPAGVWFLTQELEEWVYKAAGYQARHQAASSCQDLLDRLTGLGWMEQGHTVDGRGAYRLLHAQARPAEPLRIQLSGELIVTRETPLQVRWLLEMSADRVSHDLFTQYKVTSDSLIGAYRRGLTVDTLLADLREAAGGMLEPAFAELLQQWASDWLVEKESPQLDRARASQNSHSDRNRAAASPDFLEPCDKPSLSRLLPELPRLPIAWSAAMRSYHPSTAREMIEAAVHCQLPLQLNRQAELTVLIPDEVQELDGAWMVSGRVRGAGRSEPEHVQLPPDAWQEMKLLLPDPR